MEYSGTCKDIRQHIHFKKYIGIKILDRSAAELWGSEGNDLMEHTDFLLGVSGSGGLVLAEGTVTYAKFCAEQQDPSS